MNLTCARAARSSSSSGWRTSAHWPFANDQSPQGSEDSATLNITDSWSPCRGLSNTAGPKVGPVDARAYSPPTERLQFREY